MWFFICNTKEKDAKNDSKKKYGLSSKDMIIIPKYRNELLKQKKRHFMLLQFEQKVLFLMSCFDKKITTTLYTFFTHYNKTVSENKRIRMDCFHLLFPCNEIILKNSIHTMFDDIDDLYVLIISEFLE
jgi:hypothetical protein